MGDVIADGTVDNQSIEITGVGNYAAADLGSVTAVVVLDSEEEVEATVRISGSSTATIRDQGWVRYVAVGTPTITETTSTDRVVPL